MPKDRTLRNGREKGERPQKHRLSHAGRTRQRQTILAAKRKVETTPEPSLLVVQIPTESLRLQKKGSIIRKGSLGQHVDFRLLLIKQIQLVTIHRHIVEEAETPITKSRWNRSSRSGVNGDAKRNSSGSRIPPMLPRRLRGIGGHRRDSLPFGKGLELSDTKSH